MISVSNLSFHYHSVSPMRFPDFEVVKGQHVLLHGQSGSGKATLLHSEEWTILVGSLLLGLQCSTIPAVQAYRTDMSKVLSGN